MAGLFNRLQDEIDAQNSHGGLSPIDLLDMPQALAAVINRIIRSNGLKLENVAEDLDQSVEDTKAALDELVEKGYVRQIKVRDEIWYKAQFGRKSDKTLSAGIWSALDVFVDQEDD